MSLSNLQKYLMTQSIARSLCDSSATCVYIGWASCQPVDDYAGRHGTL